MGQKSSKSRGEASDCSHSMTGNKEFDYRNFNMSDYDLDIIQANIDQPGVKICKFKSELHCALAATSEGKSEL